MPGFVDILQAIDLSSPTGQQLLGAAVQMVTGPKESPDELRHRMALERIEAERELYRSMPTPGQAASAQQPSVVINMPGAPGASAPQTASMGVATTPAATVDPLIERLTVVSGNVKEALRFAREDGIHHPETQTRLAAAQADLVELERHDLRPEALVALPADQRQAVEALLPEIRRARQNLHNDEHGGPVTVDSVTLAAAKVGDVATGLRVARAMGKAPAQVAAPVVAPPPPALQEPEDEEPKPAPAAGDPAAAKQRPYSQYAPDMDVDTGCLPCGRAHLAGVDATLSAAARRAGERGMGDPDVQARLQTADEELTMLEAYDWTPERIARSPAQDRAILETYRPRLLGVRERLQSVQTPEDLGGLAADMAQIRQQFMAADDARTEKGDETHG